MNSGAPITIRKAVPNDATQIHSVLAVAFADYYTMLGITPPGISETTDDIKEDIGRKNVLVARASNTLTVGTVRYHMIDSVCYISRFGILPNWQSGGTGEKLFLEVERNAKELGASAIMLHSAAKLSKQVRYYYGQGFFIHSTDFSKGYIRALFIKELDGKYCIPDDFLSITEE
jgi:N-acetylglutamate synthase-like GNAT family acetyltransferase